jgi:hypothetical protein
VARPSALLLVLLVLVAAGCGGTKRISVEQAEHAFAHHGLSVKPSGAPAVSTQPAILRALRLTAKDARDLSRHVVVLSTAFDPRTFSIVLVYDFTSDGWARRAQQLAPRVFADRARRRIVHGSSTSYAGFVTHRRNLIVTGSYDKWHVVQAALRELPSR